MDYKEIIRFWFEEIKPKFWFKKDPAFDQTVCDRFMPIYIAATRCELFDWRNNPEGCLAEVIILDQFSRNLFRNSAEAFAQDSLALCLAQSAIEKGYDSLLPTRQRSFLYMPFMHSESLAIHKQALELFASPGLEDNLNYEAKHHLIIVKFGRYPHRNDVLGRTSTPEELAFLKQPGSSF